ncbi:MAG: class II fructose-bisphosphatase [Actinomycetes bacterium]
MNTPDPKLPDRNLALELARVTEFAAMGAAAWIGKGDKIAADQAAVDALHYVLARTPISGVVTSGEGTKDSAPKLYHGEEVGSGGPEVSIAIDPLEGTRLTAEGFPGAIAVIAASPKGTMFDPGDSVPYMEKIATGGEFADLLELDDPVATVKKIAARKGTALDQVTVVVLDRPRHGDTIAAIRGAGARVRLILDGDILPVLLAADESSAVDMLWGVGGTPETLIGSAACRCNGGQLLARFWPRTDGERAVGIAEGLDMERIFTAEDLVGGDDVFFSCTGVTSGEIVKGVQFRDGHVITESLSMRSRSGTIRRIEGVHDLAKIESMKKSAAAG